MSGMLTGILAVLPNAIGGLPTLALAGAGAAAFLVFGKGRIGALAILGLGAAMLLAALDEARSDRAAMTRHLAQREVALDFARAGAEALGGQLAVERQDGAALAQHLQSIANLEGACLDVPLPDAYFDRRPVREDDAAHGPAAGSRAGGL